MNTIDSVTIHQREPDTFQIADLTQHKNNKPYINMRDPVDWASLQVAQLDKYLRNNFLLKLLRQFLKKLWGLLKKNKLLGYLGTVSQHSVKIIAQKIPRLRYQCTLFWQELRVGNFSIVFDQFQKLSQYTYRINKEEQPDSYRAYLGADQDTDGDINLAEFNTYLIKKHLIEASEGFDDQLAQSLSLFLQNTANTPAVYQTKKAVLEGIQTKYGNQYVALFKEIALNEKCPNNIRALALRYLDQYGTLADRTDILKVSASLATSSPLMGITNNYNPAAQLIGMEIIAKYDCLGLSSYEKKRLPDSCLFILSEPNFLNSYGLTEIRSGLNALRLLDPVKALNCLKDLATRGYLKETELAVLLEDTKKILGTRADQTLMDIALYYGYATQTYNRIIKLLDPASQSALNATALSQLTPLSTFRYAQLLYKEQLLAQNKAPRTTPALFIPVLQTGFVARSIPDTASRQDQKIFLTILNAYQSPSSDDALSHYLQQLKKMAPALYMKTQLYTLYFNYLALNIDKAYISPDDTAAIKARDLAYTAKAVTPLNEALLKAGLSLEALQTEILEQLKPLLLKEAQAALGEWYSEKQLLSSFIYPLLNFLKNPDTAYLPIYELAQALKNLQIKDPLNLQYERFFNLLKPASLLYSFDTLIALLSQNNHTEYVNE